MHTWNFDRILSANCEDINGSPDIESAGKPDNDIYSWSHNASTLTYPAYNPSMQIACQPYTSFGTFLSATSFVAFCAEACLPLLGHVRPG
jgi:hypothetical protein